MNNVLNLSSLKKKSETMSLCAGEMEKITGGGCVTGKTNGVITGFCAVGSFLNLIVAGGCTAYAIYEYYNCA
jgi:hypothetical protein